MKAINTIYKPIIFLLVGFFSFLCGNTIGKFFRGQSLVKEVLGVVLAMMIGYAIGVLGGKLSLQIQCKQLELDFENEKNK